MESGKNVYKTSTVFSKRPILQKEGNGISGPCQQHRRLFGPSTHCTIQSIRQFLGWSRLYYQVQAGFDFCWFDVRSLNSQRLALVAYQVSQLKATNEPIDANLLLGGSGQGNMGASPALLYTTTPLLVALSCPPWSLPNITPTLRVLRWDQPEERAGESKKVQRWEYILIF